MANTQQFFSPQNQNQNSTTVLSSIRVPRSTRLTTTSVFPYHHHHQQQQQQQQQRTTHVTTQSPDHATAMLIDEPPPPQQQQQQQVARTPTMSSSKVEESEEEGKRKRDEVVDKDAVSCPICMEPWTSQGRHQVSCLPCGHIFGMSCISKWIKHRGRGSEKCPQCNAVCLLKDIRKLYGSPVVVVDGGLQKKVRSLEDEIVALKTERAHLLDVQDNLLNVQDNLLKRLSRFKEKPTSLEVLPLGGMGTKSNNTAEVQEGQPGYTFGSSFGQRQSLHFNFVLENELDVEGARLFDMDASYQILILARRISGMAGMHMLNKINLICPHENEDIQLPPSTKAVKDLRLSPCGRLALLASLGQKLSILSMGSNSVVLTYDLPGPAWSCSWDINNPSYIYAGLQNGVLLEFDMRQTIHPLRFMSGLSSQPIHTIHSLLHNPSLPYNGRKLLTASSVGPCVWNTTDVKERPFLVPELENQGICMSLAYSPSSEDIVASYSPKVRTPDSVYGQGMLGSQVLVKRVADHFYHKWGSASAYNVNDFQMTKSAIINIENCIPLFAYGDEVTHGLRLRELPSLANTQNLKPHQHPILDVKYAHSQGLGLLGCISKDKLQVFSAKVM